jgi:hypothetical protein|tara:strand:+ start:438 stop:620 length:183 start_codon:yes stop_codon:yes gene_type:complete
MQLETNDLKKMNVDELENIANTLATRLLALQTLEKESTDEYQRVAGELFHVADIIKTLEK